MRLYAFLAQVLPFAYPTWRSSTSSPAIRAGFGRPTPDELPREVQQNIDMES